MVEKIKPFASVGYSYGNDGRDGHFVICYACPKCFKSITEEHTACENCGIFFDWKQKAHIEVRREIVWK